MQDLIRFRRSAGVWTACLLASAIAAASPAPPGPREREDFFIVSSVDLVHGTMVLKRPTEVTLTMRVTPGTRCRDERGHPIPLSVLRAGDTVFIAAATEPSGQLVAKTIRQGVMTLPELRNRYLRNDR